MQRIAYSLYASSVGAAASLGLAVRVKDALPSGARISAGAKVCMCNWGVLLCQQGYPWDLSLWNWQGIAL